MSREVYELHRSVTRRTDIDIVGPDYLGRWEFTSGSTPVLSAISLTGWLWRAEVDFDQSFVRDYTTRAQLLSAADELSAQLSRTQDMATTVTVEPVSTPDRPAGVVALVEELISWLDVTYEQLAHMVGVSRGAFFYWRQSGVNPRPSNSRPILRLHSVISLLVRRFGREGAQAWLHSGPQPVWELLNRGDLDSVERAVRGSIMAQPEPLTPGPKVQEEGYIDVPSGTSTARAPRKARRRPTKGRVSESDR